MAKKFFTQSEAATKIGKRITTLVEFARVPKGTAGRVVRIDCMGKTQPAFSESQEVYDVVIQWNLPAEPTEVTSGESGGEPFILIQRGGPLEDWFARDEYEQFLLEDEEPQETDEEETEIAECSLPRCHHTFVSVGEDFTTGEYLSECRKCGLRKVSG